MNRASENRSCESRPMRADGLPRLVNGDEFLRLAEIGILPERGVELIDGIVTEMRHPRNGDDARRRFTRTDFYRMRDAEILSHGERIELLEGDILMMSPMNPRHSGALKFLNHLFSMQLGDSVICSVQDPLVLGELSEPEPDLMLLKPRSDFYGAAHPRPTDVILLVEIADTSIEFDRGRKLRAYASAGIVEYWIVDLQNRTIWVHRDPRGDTYADSQVVRSGAVAARAFPNCEVSVEALFERDGT